MKSIIKKLPDNTIELTVSIASDEVKAARNEVIESITKEADIAGFRKGMAPSDVVEKQINPDRLREEILKKLLPKTYLEAVKEQKIRPIVNPKIHVNKLGDGQVWEYTAQTCEAPEISLGDYKAKIKELTAKAKIVVPGKEPQPVNFDEIVKVILETVTMEIPQILVEGEVDRLLSQTLDDVKKLGMTLDQYLASTKRTAEDLRAEYANRARNDLKLEFALQKIAEAENITIEEKEVDEAIAKANSDTERQNLQSNRPLLAVILRQQKTLDFLRQL